MVFVPRLQLGRGLLGLGAAAPRAVPADLLVALASRAVPADLVQKLVLAGALFGAGLGAARLVPGGAPARTAAAALYAWNPLVYERLVMGHWGLLAGYAALPWVARAAIDLRAGAAHAARRLAGGLAVAAFGSPPGGLIAAGVALCLAAAPPWEGRAAAGRRAGTVLGLALLLCGPWLLPSLLRPGGLPVRPAGVAAFASRPDGPLGTVGSLLGLGGIWNRLAVPPGLGSWPWLAGFAVVLAVAAAGLPALAGRWPRGALAGLLLAAAAGLLLAAAAAAPAGRDLAEAAARHLPGAGLLRDAQKFVAPLALAEALAFGLGVERVAAALEGSGEPGTGAPENREGSGEPGTGAPENRLGRLRVAAVALLAAAPVLLLPALAWGATGRLAAVDYPPAFARARAAMAADPVPGAVLVLPWHLYLAFPWNGERVALDPAQRWFTRRSVGNDDLELAGLTVPGEDPYAARLAPLVRGGGPLAPGLPAAGVRYVLLYKVDGWAVDLPRLDGLEPVVDAPELALLRVPARPAAPPRFPAPPAAPVVAADLLAVGVAGWALLGSLSPLFSRTSRLVSSGRRPRGGPR